MLALLLPAVWLFANCAVKPPKPFIPKYVYIVLYNGKFHGYPMAIPTDPEIDIESKALVGGMCLPPDDWGKREHYIMDLEDYGYKAK